MSIIADYRAQESLARSQIDSWRMAESHNVDIFIRVGFPARLNSTHEAGQILDTMQEDRFELFMQELDGITEELHANLVAALVDSVIFQLQHFPKRRALMPLSTMISVLALYRKIKGHAKHRRILEVGAGCGYLPFLLARDASIEQYVSVEACEAFYVLQHLVNKFCYGPHSVDLCESADLAKRYFSTREGIDQRIYVDRADVIGMPRAVHLSWWHLDTLYDKEGYFDIVTSNANLNELSRPALRDYLTIFSRSLAEDGIFLVQCTGYTASGTIEELFDIIYKFQFAPIFCALAGHVSFPSPRSRFSRPTAYMMERFLALNNIVMVKQGHPLFERCYQRENFRSGFCAGDFAERMFWPGPGRQLSRGELEQEVRHQLKIRLGRTAVPWDGAGHDLLLAAK